MVYWYVVLNISYPLKNAIGENTNGVPGAAFSKNIGCDLF
jgi:hypothetical protein